MFLIRLGPVRAAAAGLGLLAILYVGDRVFNGRWLGVGVEFSHLLWNESEAYLMIDTSTSGWRMNYPDRVSMLLAIVGHPPVPDQIRRTLHVFVLDVEEERQVALAGFKAEAVVAFENHIYASIDGTHMRWNGTTFEPVGQEELQRVRNAQLRGSGPEYTNAEGWTRRSGLLREVGERRFALQLSGQTVALVVSRPFPGELAEIYVERSGQARRRIWSADFQFRRVGRDEYEGAFR